MQTSQIKIGSTYAIKDGQRIVRFVVREIRTVTVRKSAKASPIDTTSEITGMIPDGDMPDANPVDRVRTLSPSDIISDYDQHVALKAKQDEENRVRQEKADREQAERERLQALLYHFAGLTPPPKSERFYSQPISASYSGVEIRGHETVAKLLAGLEGLQAARRDLTPGLK